MSNINIRFVEITSKSYRNVAQTSISTLNDFKQQVERLLNGLKAQDKLRVIIIDDETNDVIKKIELNKKDKFFIDEFWDSYQTLLAE